MELPTKFVFESIYLVLLTQDSLFFFILLIFLFFQYFWIEYLIKIQILIIDALLHCFFFYHVIYRPYILGWYNIDILFFLSITFPFIKIPLFLLKINNRIFSLMNELEKKEGISVATNIWFNINIRFIHISIIIVTFSWDLDNTKQ